MGQIHEDIQEFKHSTSLGKSVDISAPPLHKSDNEKKQNIFESFLGINKNKMITI